MSTTNGSMKRSGFIIAGAQTRSSTKRRRALELEQVKC
jgi:hypothetical protein